MQHDKLFASQYPWLHIHTQKAFCGDKSSQYSFGYPGFKIPNNLSSSYGILLTYELSKWLWRSTCHGKPKNKNKWSKKIDERHFMLLFSIE